jgi:hypothetical protein
MKNESHVAKNVAAGQSRWPCQMRSIYEIVPTILFCNIARRLCLSYLFMGDVIGQATLSL